MTEDFGNPRCTSAIATRSERQKFTLMAHDGHKSLHPSSTMPRHHRRMARARVTPEFIDIESPPITRAILAQILDHTHVVGFDERGWAIVQHEFTCPPWLLDKLACYGAREADLEDEDSD